MPYASWIQKTAYIFAISEIRIGFESALYRPPLSSIEQFCTEKFLTITLSPKLALLAPAICRNSRFEGEAAGARKEKGVSGKPYCYFATFKRGCVTMARKPRVHFAGALYHVMCRGNQGQSIFKGDPDRERYLEFLIEGQKRFGYRLYAYVLMGITFTI